MRTSIVTSWGQVALQPKPTSGQYNAVAFATVALCGCGEFFRDTATERFPGALAIKKGLSL
jgi:hypothetical protein